jgi:rhodanese-related sulfurtransferase
MFRLAPLVLLLALLAPLPALEGDFSAPNPQIDFAAFLRNASEANAVRERHRLSEQRFIEVAAQPGVVVLDARSHAMYDLLHVRSAINLPFPDINVETLATLLPDKDQTILIYCNNNFRQAPKAFANKAPPASLNISTFIALHTYGYRNVFELGPVLDVQTTAIPFVGKKE